MAQGTSARVASSRKSLRFVEGAVLTKKRTFYLLLDRRCEFCRQSKDNRVHVRVVELALTTPRLTKPRRRDALNEFGKHSKDKVHHSQLSGVLIGIGDVNVACKGPSFEAS